MNKKAMTDRLLINNRLHIIFILSHLNEVETMIIDNFVDVSIFVLLYRLKEDFFR